VTTQEEVEEGIEGGANWSLETMGFKKKKEKSSKSSQKNRECKERFKINEKWQKRNKKEASSSIQEKNFACQLGKKSYWKLPQNAGLGKWKFFK